MNIEGPLSRIRNKKKRRIDLTTIALAGGLALGVAGGFYGYNKFKKEKQDILLDLEKINEEKKILEETNKLIKEEKEILSQSLVNNYQSLLTFENYDKLRSNLDTSMNANVILGIDQVLYERKLKEEEAKKAMLQLQFNDMTKKYLDATNQIEELEKIRNNNDWKMSQLNDAKMRNEEELKRALLTMQEMQIANDKFSSKYGDILVEVDELRKAKTAAERKILEQQEKLNVTIGRKKGFWN